MASKDQSLIPSGYAFFGSDALMSDAGREILHDLLKKAHNRNPDNFDMYVYNDFYPYALIDLIDTTFATIHGKITKKAYDDAFPLLEALTFFFDCESAWPMCDDDRRVKNTDNAYGALLVALLKGLQEEGHLDKAHFPALEYFLKKAAAWGSSMKDLDCELEYHLYCKWIGEQFFKNKSDEDKALDKARVEEWIKTLSKEQQEDMREELEEEAEAENEKGVWYLGGEDVSSKIALPRVWKEYKAYLVTVPRDPVRGYGWDISKWSAAQQKEFAFDDEI